jgi:hypothetical protein
MTAQRTPSRADNQRPTTASASPLSLYTSHERDHRVPVRVPKDGTRKTSDAVDFTTASVAVGTQWDAVGWYLFPPPHGGRGASSRVRFHPPVAWLDRLFDGRQTVTIL